MANTQVFTLGFSVTASNPLGNAIEQLRRDLERLRRQADGTRFGRLIGEVIRLGLELGKVRQAERELALDQEQRNEEQIARLDDEVGAVERLRRHYVLLDQVIAGLTRLKPWQSQPAVIVVQQSLWVMPGQRGAAAGRSQDSLPAPTPPKPDTLGTMLRGAAVVAGAVGATVGGGYIAREGLRRLPPNTQRRVTKLARTHVRKNLGGTLGDIGKALITGEDGEAKAEGVGASIGEFGGRLFGTVLPRLSKSKWARKYGAGIGSALGEAAGEAVAGLSYRWVTQRGKEQPIAGGVPDRAGGDGGAPPGQGQPQQAATAISTTAVMASRRVVFSGLRSDSATNAEMAIVSATSAHWQDSLLATNGASLLSGQEAERGSRDGPAVVDEAGGAAVMGSPDGTALDGSSESRGSEPSLVDEDQTGDATVPSVIVNPAAWAVPAMLPALARPTLGTSLRLPKAAKLLKGAPAMAVLDTALQVVSTYNSDGTTAQKMEGYGSAAGGLGGTFAGMAVGAALGSVVPVLGTALGGLIGGVVGGIGGDAVGGWLGRVVASVTGNDMPVEGTGPGTAKQPHAPISASALAENPPGSAAAPVAPAVVSQAAPAPAINQQFTFTANMPVTFTNTFDDPTTLQQLEAIARRVLDDLMRQARAVQMVDQPQP